MHVNTCNLLFHRVELEQQVNRKMEQQSGFP